MTIPQTLGIFVGIPVLAYVLMSLLVWAGRTHRRPRYRPGQEWTYPPQWWAGDQPVVPSVVIPGTARGGARGTW